MTTAARPPAGPSQKTAEGVPVSFAQFLVSLGSSALVHLGEVADPSMGRTKRNLPLANNPRTCAAVTRFTMGMILIIPICRLWLGLARPLGGSLPT